MNLTWEVICHSINASLLNGEFTPLSDVDWADVFDQTKRQGITGVVYHSIGKYLPASLDAEWNHYNLKRLSHSVRLIHEQHDLCTLLYDIPFIILKGTASAVYYPSPLQRTMGDIDFIVEPCFFEEAKLRLINAGYAIIDEENPRHIELSRNGISLEMHHHFGHDALNIDQFISRCYEQLDVGIIQNTSFPMLPRLENGLVLLAHLRQHLFTGIGLRQVLDWMMFVKSTVDDIYWEKVFRPEVRNLGLEKLAITASRLCQLYFGLDKAFVWCSLADEAVCHHLMESFIESGNFGHINGRGKNVEATVINLRREGIFAYLQKAGEYNWQAYHRHPSLKPFAWMYQIGRYARQGFSAGRSAGTIKEDIQRSKDRYDLIKELDL